MSEDIGTSSCSTSPGDGVAGPDVGHGVGNNNNSTGGGRTSASLHEDISGDQPPREPTPASFSVSSREYNKDGGGSSNTTTGTPGTASSSGRHSSLSHGGRSSSYLGLAHTPPPLDATQASNTLPQRPDTPLSATAPQTNFLSHTPPSEGNRSPFSMSGLHAALPASLPPNQRPMGVTPALGSSSTSLTMIGNPIHNPGASYSRYSSGVVTPHDSAGGYDAGSDANMYSGGGSYGYSRIDTKLTGDEFEFMDDDSGLPGSHPNMNAYPGIYGPGPRGGPPPNPTSLMYSSESLGSTNDSPNHQPETGIYEDESIFDQPPPPPAPTSSSTKSRDKNKKQKFFKNYYDKSSLNQLLSSSAKVSNREMSLNCGDYETAGGYSSVGLTEMFTDPVEEEGGERVFWEHHSVTLTRVPGYGFGIAVSGGRDNPHFRNGDPSIAISDVLKAGPAEGKLEVNDRLIAANGISLEGVDYARAVQVLRDSGASVHLTVRRRVVLPPHMPPPGALLGASNNSTGPQTLTVTLTRTKKKEDYGVVLGCRLYIKEIVRGGLAARNGGLKEGDELLRINTSPTDDLSLKEARKMLESQKEQLQLVVKRQPSSTEFCDPGGGMVGYGAAAAQNLYVQPPTRPPPDTMGHYPPPPGPPPLLPLDKNNLNRYAGVPGGGPDFQYGSVGDGGGVSSPTDGSAAGVPPRPPLPRPEDYYVPPGQQRPNTTNNSTASPDGGGHHGPATGQSPTKPHGPVPEARYVSFHKEGSVGIRLTGGNEVGIFVTAVQPSSQAQLQGIVPGDKVLKVNEMDMTGVTREEAVLYLMSLQEKIELIVQTRIAEYQKILSSQKGDLFYIKTHFHYDPEGTGELSFRSGDIFRVVDTLHGGVVGSWQVERIGRNNQETQRGTIPNKSRAEELATAQFNAAKKEQTQSESRSGFFKRRRNSRRSKSLGKDHWEDVVFGDSMSKFPAYERVSLQHPGFVRPVVLFGPLADVARSKLLSDHPDHFSSPQMDNNGEKQQASIIRLSAIREIIERGKHPVLDITPSAVDRLNYAQFYPIVIYLRVDSKQAVKEMRAGFPNLLCSRGRQSSKKLFEQSLKVERLWGHVFTSTLTLTQPDTWPRKLFQAITQHQAQPIWMAQNKQPSESLSDDFLFPMTSRLSYASSPESDLDGGSDPHTPHHHPSLQHNTATSSPSSSSPPNSPTSPPSTSASHRLRMVKSSSDPSIAAAEELLLLQQSGGGAGYHPSPPSISGAPPPYSANPRMPNTPESGDDRRKSHGGDSKYGFGGGGSTGGGSAGDGYVTGRLGTNSDGYGRGGSASSGSAVNNAVPPPSTSSHGSPPHSITYGYGGGNSQQPPPLPAANNPHSTQMNSPHHPHFTHHSRLPPPPPSTSASSPAATSTPSTNNSRFPNSPRHHHNHPPPSSQPQLPPPPPTHQNFTNYSPNKPPQLTNGHGPSPQKGPQSPKSGSTVADGAGPAVPPKIDRSNKPGKMGPGGRPVLPPHVSNMPPPSQQHHHTQQQQEYDNYINTGRPKTEQQQPPAQQKKGGYAEQSPIGPNAHDDLKSRYHHTSYQQHPRYSRSASQPPAFQQEDPYSMKSGGAPKGGPGKPVPPPKPRQYRGDGGQWSGGHDKRMPHTSNGRLSDDYSAIDSGHGSSLERKCDTFGRTNYSKQAAGSQGYYLNVPMPRGEPPSGGGGGGGGRDLPNHDHRGSAFELYKKPADPRARHHHPQQQQQQQYYSAPVDAQAGGR